MTPAIVDNVQRPVFVVTSGRSGSTLLSDMLRLHPSILSLSEFFSMLGGPRVFSRDPLSGAACWRLLHTPDSDLRELLRQTDVPEVLARAAHGRETVAELSPMALVTLPHLSDDPVGLSAAIEQQVLQHPVLSIGEHIERLFDWLRDRFERRVWIERSGGSLEYADALRAHFPNARFVLLVRDGRDTAYSMARHPMFRVRLARILAGRHDLPVADCLRAELPLHRFGAYWSALMHKGQRFLSTLPPQETLMIRYEDLVTDTARPLERVASFMGIEPSPRWIERAHALTAPRSSHWLDLPQSEREALEAACRPGMRILQRWSCASPGESLR
jgi:hypothetical protein